MIADIRFHEDAQKEFNEAAAFYAMEEEGLGAAFVDCVERAVARIAEHPESSPVLADRVRKMHVADSRIRCSIQWFKTRCAS